jgi:hypothetical protein
MSDKYWYKVETNEGEDSTTHHYGSSSLSFELLIASLQRGEYIQLNDVLYLERGSYKEWAEWAPELHPSKYINPNCILNVMQYIGDPRATPKKQPT